VGGAWVDNTTRTKAEAMGFAWADVAADNNSHLPLVALDQLVRGGHTGWNLCDLYVACVESRSADSFEQELDR
jgi:glycerate-2-kinase